MQTLIVDLTITADEYLKYYQSRSTVVVCRSRDGRRVHFPAEILQPFVSHAGVSGSFSIAFDDAGKFKKIIKM
ncbi:MAG: hypothetical protein ACJAYG_001646 [Oceanicoccus sp.]|jgi:hypothetical protein